MGTKVNKKQNKTKRNENLDASLQHNNESGTTGSLFVIISTTKANTRVPSWGPHNQKQVQLPSHRGDGIGQDKTRQTILRTAHFSFKRATRWATATIHRKQISKIIRVIYIYT